MSVKKNHVLTPKERDSIIREIVDNPKLSKETINEKAGISSRGSREDKLLKPWIKENARLVFGEDIRWCSESLTSMRGNSITPDFIGVDSQDDMIIVEVKFRFEFRGDKKHLTTDPEKKSIGQILQYACAYMRKHSTTPIPRLFIVSIDFSQDVEAVCKFLRSKGIDIRHITVEKVLSKRT